MAKVLTLRTCTDFFLPLQLNVTEDALVKFKNELAVMELEIQVKIYSHLLTFYAVFILPTFLCLTFVDQQFSYCITE